MKCILILRFWNFVRLYNDKDSSVGQATVYRNVSKLVEEGKVRRVLTNDGVDHYDADCSQHVHFVCQKMSSTI